MKGQRKGNELVKRKGGRGKHMSYLIITHLLYLCHRRCMFCRKRMENKAEAPPVALHCTVEERAPEEHRYFSQVKVS
jgi:hypothetical protein